MNSMISSDVFANSMSAWRKLAWNAGEMMVSSMQVIGQRSARFLPSASTAAMTGERDKRELLLMGNEKTQAALESVQAVGTQMLVFNQQFAALAFKQIFSASPALLAIASSRTATQSADRQARLVGETLSNSAVAAAKLSDSTVRVANVAMRPVHRRVKANVRRLGKRQG